VIDADWWAPALETALSQGDIVSDLYVTIGKSPPTHLKSRTGKGGAKIWNETGTPFQENGAYHTLAIWNDRHAIVITHSCELDKPTNKRVHVAPVALLSSIDARIADNIRTQQTKGQLILPAIPGLGDCYADLRVIAPVQRDLIESAPRIASMTPAALDRLHDQLVAFFIRKERLAD
jgi:hypothetical protein